MSKLKAILKGLLANQYKLAGLQTTEQQAEADQLKTKLNELLSVEKDEDLDTDAISAQFNSLDKIRVSHLHNASYGKGKKEELSKWEQKVREKLSIGEDDLKGDDLINKVSEIIEETKTSAAEASKVKDEDVEKHPKFVAAAKEWQSKLKAAEKKVETEVAKVQAEFAKKEQMITVGKDALAKLAAFKPVKLSNANAAAAQEARFLKDLEQYDWRNENGKWIAYDKDGQPVKDDHGNFADFETLVEKTAGLHYDFEVNTDREFPEGEDPKKKKQEGGETKGKKYQGKMPTNQAEYLKLVNDRSLSIEQRREISQHYEQNQKQAQPA
jgi:hypothetical protein